MEEYGEWPSWLARDDGVALPGDEAAASGPFGARVVTHVPAPPVDSLGMPALSVPLSAPTPNILAAAETKPVLPLVVSPGGDAGWFPEASPAPSASSSSSPTPAPASSSPTPSSASSHAQHGSGSEASDKDMPVRSRTVSRKYEKKSRARVTEATNALNQLLDKLAGGKRGRKRSRAQVLEDAAELLRRLSSTGRPDLGRASARLAWRHSTVPEAYIDRNWRFLDANASYCNMCMMPADVLRTHTLLTKTTGSAEVIALYKNLLMPVLSQLFGPPPRPNSMSLDLTPMVPGSKKCVLVFAPCAPESSHRAVLEEVTDAGERAVALRDDEVFAVHVVMHVESHLSPAEMLKAKKKMIDNIAAMLDAGAPVDMSASVSVEMAA